MHTINIIDFADAEMAISYENGQLCLKEVLEYIDTEDISLDFDGVEFVITAFLNPIIGDLILKKGPDIMKKVKIVNANNSTIEKIKLVRDGALVKREDLE